MKDIEFQRSKLVGTNDVDVKNFGKISSTIAKVTVQAMPMKHVSAWQFCARWTTVINILEANGTLQFIRLGYGAVASKIEIRDALRVDYLLVEFELDRFMPTKLKRVLNLTLKTDIIVKMKFLKL